MIFWLFNIYSLISINFAIRQDYSTSNPIKQAIANGDEITDKLPGQDFEIKFKQYSGMVFCSSLPSRDSNEPILE